jgi:hypothetical protein
MYPAKVICNTRFVEKFEKINSKVNIVRRMPTLQEFKDLRNDAGWKMPPDSAIQQGLNNSVCGVCAESPDKRTIGMGRIVGAADRLKGKKHRAFRYRQVCFNHPAQRYYKARTAIQL